VTTLVQRWRAAVRGVGVAGDDADLDAAGVYLLGRWSEPQRQYHDVTHLAAVLDVVDRFADLAPHPDRVRVAAWMHDAVYDPRALGDANERDSAEFARGLLDTLGAPAEVADEVARLVGLTAGHATDADDPDGALLCDADLAVLAGPPASYAAYASAVREEYGHLSDEEFTAGRIAVLEHLLDLETLFRLPAVAGEWTPRARANLTAELSLLRSRSASSAADPPPTAG